MMNLLRLSSLFSFFWSAALFSHPYFPEKGVDALLFLGPTLSAISLDTHSVSFSYGSVASFTPSLSPGFTAGARLLLDHDSWDGGLLYSWNKNETSVSQNAPNALQYNIANAFPFPVYTSFPISGTLDTSFKTLFLEIGRFLTNDKKQGGLFRLHFGFAGTWENETLSLNASDTYSMSLQQDVWGAGFRTGAEMWYYFVPQFAFHATAATSLLWTRYRVRRMDSAETVTDIKIESNYWKNSPGIDMSFGLHAEKAFTNLIISGDFAWFLQTWTNHLRLFLLTEPQQQGDLSLQGISLTASLSF